MKIIKRIKLCYHIKMAERAVRDNNKEKYKKHSVKARKLIWE